MTGESRYTCYNPDCDEPVQAERRQLGYVFCLDCGERVAKSVGHGLVVVEGHKQGATAYTQSGARMALKCNNKKSNLWRD